MNLPPLKSHGHTVEEWKTWEGRWELINGVAYDMTPAPSLEHQRISSDLHGAIWTALGEAKRWAYAAAGVPEYLIVDPSEHVAMLLRLESGHYVDSAPIQWGAVMALLGGKLPIMLG